jgi:hypothetical protein
MDDPLRSKQDAAIEDAQRTHPVAALPVDLTPGVMARIRSVPAARFRPAAADLIPSAVLALTLGSVWFGFESLPAPTLVHMRIQGILFWQSLIVNARWWLPLLSIASGLALAYAALLSLRTTRPM